MCKLSDIATIAAAIALCVWSATFETRAQTVPADSSFYSRYPYILFVEADEAPATLSDEAFLDIAAPITFPVNRYSLPLTDLQFRQLADEVLPRLNRDSLRLRRMVVRGAASPEGPYSRNEFLSDNRARVLFDYVKQTMTFAPVEDVTAISAEVEDYPLLCVMMKRAGDPDYVYVKQVCDQYLGEREYGALKETLRKAQGGRLWKRLLAEYFPQLRAARIVLYIEKAPVGQPTMVEVPDVDISKLVQPDTIPSTPIIPVAQKDSVPTTPTPQYTTVRLPRRELLSVKTNLLFYGIYMPGYNRWCPIPNVAIEYYPKRGHFTFGASFDMPWWQDYKAHKYFQIRNYQLEARYYLRSGSIENNPPGKGAAFRGLYLQGYVHAGLFGICFDENRGWVGEGGGAGIGIGYVMPFTRKGHWRLEFGLQAGFFRCKYDPYQYENPVNPNYRDGLYYYKWTDKPSLFKKRQYRWNWFGPTRIGITLTYDLLYRRSAKKGISFKSYEEERRELP